MVIECEQCGRRIERPNYNQRFCSDVCKHRYRRRANSWPKELRKALQVLAQAGADIGALADEGKAKPDVLAGLVDESREAVAVELAQTVAAAAPICDLVLVDGEDLKSVKAACRGALARFPGTQASGLATYILKHLEGDKA